jgi:hypothetical protein
MNINDTILKAINDELPAAVGTELKKRLDQLDKLEQENKTLRCDLETRDAKLRAHNDLLTRESAVSGREGATLARERAVSDREAKVSLLEQETKFARELAHVTERLFNTVFANNIIKTSVCGSRTEITSSPGGYTSTQSVPFSKNTEVQG